MQDPVHEYLLLQMQSILACHPCIKAEDSSIYDYYYNIESSWTNYWSNYSVIITFWIGLDLSVINMMQLNHLFT